MADLDLTLGWCWHYVDTSISVSNWDDILPGYRYRGVHTALEYLSEQGYPFDLAFEDTGRRATGYGGKTEMLSRLRVIMSPEVYAIYRLVGGPIPYGEPAHA